MTIPPGFVALTLGKGCVCVIPERVYVARLRLGKTLRLRKAMEQRKAGRKPKNTTSAREGPTPMGLARMLAADDESGGGQSCERALTTG